MDKKKKIWVVIFILIGVASLARYFFMKSERQIMEERISSLSRMQREAELSRTSAPVAPTPDDSVKETRDMYASELPREYLEAIKEAVGKEFKLMELLFDKDYVQATVSIDGQSAQTYTQRRGSKKIEGPGEVKLIGDNPLTHSLYELKDADLSLLPKLTKEAIERAGIADGKVSSARFSYQIIRYKGESPTWTLMVERGTPPDWEHKFVTFDAKGKFKSVS